MTREQIEEVVGGPELVDVPAIQIERLHHRERDRYRPGQWHIVAAVSAGGVLGALARYGIGRAWPHRVDRFDWPTFAINVAGCLLIGIAMVTLTEAYITHPLLRPFLGTGILGGFTTFSTYILDIVRLGRPATALVYLLSTMAAALAAVWLSTWATRRILL
jgi:fluoride exporter